MRETFDLQKHILSMKDLTGDNTPSRLFSYMIKNLGYLLDPDVCLATERQLRFRRSANKIIKVVAQLFLHNRQIIENRNTLRGINEPDTGIQLPNTPVVWAGNHSFKDDVLATVLVARHSYILFGSLPMFYNTFDGIMSFLNGVVMVNRKITTGRDKIIRNSINILRHGTDLLLFPEGVWNKTPEKLLLEFWPGIYRISVEFGCPIVPVIHYLREPHIKGRDNPIHTVVDDPIDLACFSERQGLRYLRDVMATWFYLMLERYGKTTRDELLNGYDYADEAWDAYLSLHTGAVPYYDREIETSADFRPDYKKHAVEVFTPIANIKSIHKMNVQSIVYARDLVAIEKRRDFQRRF